MNKLTGRASTSAPRLPNLGFAPARGWLHPLMGALALLMAVPAFAQDTDGDGVLDVDDLDDDNDGILDILESPPISLEGDDFFLLFQNNFSAQDRFLYVAGAQGTEVFIDSVSQGLIDSTGLMTITVTRGDHTVDAVDATAPLHLTASAGVTVFGLCAFPEFTADAFTAIPVKALGQSYHLLGFNPTLGNQVSVVAVEDNTTAVIDGVTVTLQRGESYSRLIASDITG